MTDPTELRGQQRDRWEAAAPGWEQRAATVSAAGAPVADWLVKAAELGRGDRVLEVAAGLGDVGFKAAQIVGSGGEVVISDGAEAMVEGAARRAEQFGLTQVTVVRMEAEWLDADAVKEFCPIVDISPEARYPVMGATLQRRGGIARHDAVIFALGRACDALGVDIIQGCEVTDIDVVNGRVTGLQTSRGPIAAGKVGLVAAGRTSLLTAMAGFAVPIQSHPLQALVSEVYEQVLNCVVMSNAVHVYVSQAHKGELVMGAGIDAFNSYAQRGGLHVIEEQMSAGMQLFPQFSRARVLRTWGGIVDVCPDASPIVGLTPVENLYVNCGWGTGGFKATPGSGWVMAHTIATGEPHALNRPFSLERFETGELIDEHGAAAVAH